MQIRRASEAPLFFCVLLNSRAEIRLAKPLENYTEPKPLLLPGSNGEIKHGTVRQCYLSTGNPPQSPRILVPPGLTGAQTTVESLPHSCAFKGDGGRNSSRKVSGSLSKSNSLEWSVIDFSNEHSNRMAVELLSGSYLGDLSLHVFSLHKHVNM